MKKITAITFLSVGLIWMAKGQQTETPAASNMPQPARPHKVAPQPDQNTVVQKMLRLEQTLSSKYPMLTNIDNALPPVLMGTELLLDGGFEDGWAPSRQFEDPKYAWRSSYWLWFSETGMNPIWMSKSTAHTGTYCAYFSVSGPSTSAIIQLVNIPSNSTTTLSYWIKIGNLNNSPDDDLAVAWWAAGFDGGTVWPTGYGTVLREYTPANETPNYSWVRHSLDLSSLAGKSIYIGFYVTQAESVGAVFQIDDVSVVTNALISPTPTPTPTITSTPTPRPTITSTPTPTPTPTAPSGVNSKVVYSSGTAHAAGSNGAFWMTDMTFANGSTSDLFVKVFLNNATGNEQFGFSLPSGSARTIVDVVQFFGLQDGSYVLRTEASCPVHAPACSVDQFSATARTYSQGYGGWFGTSLPSMTSFTGIKTLAFQEIANSRKALYVFGTPTLAVAYDKNGTIVSTLDLGIFSAGKLTRVPLNENVSYIRISVTPNSFCYGTQVDNATQSQIIIN